MICNPILKRRLTPIRWSFAVCLAIAGWLWPSLALAQGGAVAGRVVDAQSLRPLDGVQITIEGSTVGTQTDANGTFRFANVSGTQVTLQLRRIGYRPGTEQVTVGRTDLRLTLTEVPAVLNQIVVTGTAEPVEKRALGTTVAKVDAARVQEVAPAANMSSLINGRAPGVVLIAGSGAVGAGPRIRIRGGNSFSLSDQPLVYVDGIRVASDVSTGPTTQFFSSAVISRLNDIDPDDIESVEIVKGPAAATLYGTEASNGVVQIITKRGKVGRPTFTATVRQGVNSFNDAQERIGFTYNRDPQGAIRRWNPVEFYKTGTGNDLFKNGLIGNYNLGLNGGTEQVRYNLNAGYDNEQGIEPTNKLWRVNGNANISIAARPNFDINATVSTTQQQVNLPLEAGGGMWFSAFFGQYPRTAAEELRFGFFSAPPDAFWGAFKDWQRVSRTTTSLQLNHRLGQWFNHRLIVGSDLTEEDNLSLTQRMGPYFRQFFGSPTQQAGGKLTRRRELNVTSVDYGATVNMTPFTNIGSRTSFGAQFFRRNNYLVAARGEGFATTGLTQVDANATTFGGEATLENSTLGFYGQEQIDYQDRLFLTVALRVDDNSAFGDNFSWIQYPKVALAYSISEEPWWKWSFIEALKLRAAYGETGQQPIVNSALRTFSSTTTGDGGSGVTPNTVGNPDLKAERGKEIELGFETSVLQDRVGFEFTYYTRTIQDAIVSSSVAPSSGFPSTRFVNIGEIKGNGIELAGHANVWSRRNLNIDVNLNYSHNDNEVTKLPPGVQFLGTGNIRHQIGYPVGGYWEPRIVSAEFTPDGRTTNEMCDDGKGGVTPCLNAAKTAFIAPRVFIGRSDAPNEGSVSAAATLYQRLRFYGLLDFKNGHKQFDNNHRARCQVFLVCMANLEPRNYPATLIAQYNTNNLLRNFGYADPGYMKLREVSASYSLPDRLARRAGFATAAVTVSGRNLHTWTKWTGIDPESFFTTEQYARTEQAQVPPLRTYLVSFNVTF